MEENNQNVVYTTQPNYEGVQVNVPQQEVAPQQVQATYVGDEVSNVSNPADYVTSTAPAEPAYTQAPIQQTQEAQVQPAQVQEAQVQQAEQPASAQAKPQEKPLNIINVEADKKIIVKTSLIKDALRKASVVASCNELSPITEVVMLRVLDNGIMQVRATDRENIVTINVPVIEATQNLIITLKIAQIKPLIDRLSGDTTAFVEENSIVTIISDSGKYKFSQAVDLTTNEVIVVPDVDMDSIPFAETKEIGGDRFSHALEVTYPLISGIQSESPYSGVYFGQFISSTTGADISSIRESFQDIFGEDVFIKSSTIKYLISMGFGEKVNIGLGLLGNTRTMCVYTDNYRLYAVLKDDKEDYPESDVSTLISAPVGVSVSINRAKLLESLNRLDLFFSNTARQSLQAEVKNGQMKISNENKAFELLPAKATAEFEVKFDFSNLELALKSLKGDEITISSVTTDVESQNGVITTIRVSAADSSAFVISAAI